MVPSRTLKFSMGAPRYERSKVWEDGMQVALHVVFGFSSALIFGFRLSCSGFPKQSFTSGRTCCATLAVVSGDLSNIQEQPCGTFIQTPPRKEYEVVLKSEETSGGWTDEEWSEWKKQQHGKHYHVVM